MCYFKLLTEGFKIDVHVLSKSKFDHINYLYQKYLNNQIIKKQEVMQIKKIEVSKI